jgi:hypothetical protein
MLLAVWAVAVAAVRRLMTQRAEFRFLVRATRAATVHQQVTVLAAAVAALLRLVVRLVLMLAATAVQVQTFQYF